MPCAAMKLPVCTVLFFAFSWSQASAVTPVQKVIQLLEGMMQKGKQEKHEEQVQFAAYKQFCTDTIAEKTASVSELGEEMELLQASIQKAGTDADTAADKVRELNADIATWSADEKAAAAVRETERAAYLTSHKEYSDTIDAVTRAYQVVQSQAYNRPQAQTVSLLMGSEGVGQLSKARQVLEAFLAGAADAAAAPEAHAYEYRSTSVLDMLQKLKDKFVDERTVLEKEEMQKRHAHELLVQDLQKSVTAAEESVAEKVQQKAKFLQASASQRSDLEDATRTRTDDQQYLQKMTASCSQKEQDYQECQQLRADEITAIQKAIEILSSDQVQGTATKYLPSMLQSASGGSALLQLHEDDQSPVQMHVAAYLRNQGEKIHSRVLSALALRVHDDPFSKVKKMIQDLISRLQEEAGEEVQHKSWCDSELQSNEQARNSRTTEVERLSSEIDSLTSSIAQLAADLAELHQRVADTDQQNSRETQLRQEEKATNTQTVKDAQEAQTAVAQALTVLKEFYAKAGESTALVQKPAGKSAALVQQPEIFDSPYKGMQSEKGGVVGMLEVVESDFARLEAETSAAEATAQKTYDEFMTDSKVDKAAKNKDVEHKTAKKQDESQALTSKRSDLDGTQKELDAALAYYDKLKPSCVDAGVSYEDRVARRKAEIESLQEALRILNGEDIAR
mmetsp:Transcript_150890/g.366494  ORF Transcript_150890/g.366494 Transcript_150890/m.366494 type:complete len:679 (+) Transcript_150890:77-2113(+)